MILKEGRNPAPLPAPHSFTDWMWFPASVDAYLRDHFGLRQAMIHPYRDLKDSMFDRPPVLIGQDGRMFYLGDEMALQATGRVLRAAKVAETADLVATVRGALAKRGIAFPGR
jgi:alginate O-acetyltransferase complex protein AlgJ